MKEQLGSGSLPLRHKGTKQSQRVSNLDNHTLHTTKNNRMNDFDFNKILCASLLVWLVAAPDLYHEGTKAQSNHKKEYG